MSRVYGWDYENERLKMSKLDDDGNPIDKKYINSDESDKNKETDTDEFVISLDDIGIGA